MKPKEEMMSKRPNKAEKEAAALKAQQEQSTKDAAEQERLLDEMRAESERLAEERAALMLERERLETVQQAADAGAQVVTAKPGETVHAQPGQAITVNTVDGREKPRFDPPPEPVPDKKMLAEAIVYFGLKQSQIMKAVGLTKEQWSKHFAVTKDLPRLAVKIITRNACKLIYAPGATFSTDMNRKGVLHRCYWPTCTKPMKGWLDKGDCTEHNIPLRVCADHAYGIIHKGVDVATMVNLRGINKKEVDEEAKRRQAVSALGMKEA